MARKPPGSAAQSTDPAATGSVPLGKPALPPGPQRIGKYELVRLIGQGSMGLVYEASDTILERRAALKLLPEAAAGDSVASAKLLAEARAVARLTHPDVVIIYEAGQAEEGFYLAMELVEGGTLMEAMHRRGPFAPDRAARLIARVCRALQAAHATGLIHRDIKPSNLLVTKTGQVKLS